MCVCVCGVIVSTPADVHIGCAMEVHFQLQGLPALVHYKSHDRHWSQTCECLQSRAGPLLVGNGNVVSIGDAQSVTDVYNSMLKNDFIQRAILDTRTLWQATWAPEPEAVGGEMRNMSCREMPARSAKCPGTEGGTGSGQSHFLGTETRTGTVPVC